MEMKDCNKLLRNRAKRRAIMAACLMLVPVLWVAGCGSSRAPVGISVTPGTSALTVGQTQTFTATVTNTSNSGVTWTIQEGSAGGSISSNGLYTAPMKAGSYHVVATSVADPSKSTSAAIRATAPAPAFTSTAPTVASEGVTYSYAVTATDPVNTEVTYSLKSGPTGAAISGATLSWTPTHAQSRTSNSFDVVATTAAGGTADQTFTVTPIGIVRGTAIDTYLTATGSVTKPEDLSNAYIGVSFQNGSSWTTVQGVGLADGTFTVSGVPTGSYWLAIASGGYWTSASDLDLGQDFVGRPDAVNASNGTSLGLSFAGLNAFATDDEVDIYNPNLGQDFDWSENLNIGDTTFASVWNWTGPLSISGKGDNWFVIQSHPAAVGPAVWRMAVTATPALPLDQKDADETDLTGRLDTATSLTVHMAVKGSQFAAAAANAGSGSSIHATTVGVYSQPFSATKGSVGENENLLETKDQTPITQDADYGDIAVGNPFPDSFTPYVAARYEVHVPFTATGANAAVQVPAELYLSSTQMPTKDAPLTPQITPVQNLRLNSAAFVQGLATKTLNPTLSWDAPATGTPTGYRVSVYSLTVTGTSGSSFQPVLDLFTNDHTLTIPSGILAAGGEYFFQIRAFLAPGVDFTSAPYHGVFPWSHADLLTPVMSTAGATGSVAVAEALQHVVNRPASAPVAGNPARAVSRTPVRVNRN
ncbi:hypothetical protein DYQ86_10325 [Acidobacteria bacterium AB60]|nr:hypothetical protein DYQ86_10325 [Acidobacteria bacterium AB60]